MDTLHVALPGEPAAASMGNPHVTFFVPDIDAVDIATEGPRFEHDALFPERANVGFAQILDRTTIRLRVWERGAGLTLACGSGACAALVNACRRDLTDRQARVILDGGILDIAWREDGHVMMVGPATTVFAGEVDLP
jgi:diaminopimelate epimerase